MDKKKVKDVITGIIVIVVLVTLVITLYRCETDRARRDFARSIAALSPRGGPPETIENLMAAIALYEEQIERNVNEGVQTGMYWRILGIRLAGRGMYRDALNAMERAIHFNALDPMLFFLTGEYARILAMSTLDFSENSIRERERLFNLSESAYLRAIELDPIYVQPRLGLGELYFVLGRTDEAIPHLERLLELSPHNIRGMDILAQSHFIEGNPHRAIDLYERIILSRASTPEEREAAQYLISFIQDNM